MKNTIIIIAIITAIIVSFGCNKDGKMVETTISGQLRTNGTQDVIRMSPELEKPTVDIYHVYWSGTTGAAGGGGNTYEIIATIPVTSDGKYSVSLDLNDNDDYYVGFSNIDENIYIQRYYSFYGSNDVNRHNHITIGGYNDIILYVGATSWIIPRFVNTNPNVDNVDVFDCSEWGVLFEGATDSIMNWVGTTSSGTYYNGYGTDINKAHHVVGKLTRNGITENVKIIYNVPPFDTSIVVIEY